MSLLLWIAAFVVSLAVLIKASDVFTVAAEKLGILLGIPPFIIGVTIVAMGTSLPELVSSVIAAGNGAPEIVVGNVVGSNITNIFLVLGVAALLSRDVRIHYAFIHLDLAFLLAVTALLMITCWDGTFSRWDALACIAFMVVHVVYNLKLDHGPIEAGIEAAGKIAEELRGELGAATAPEVAPYWGDDGAEAPATAEEAEAAVGWKLSLTLLLASLFIYLGARYTVEAVVAVSDLLGVGKEIVAVTAVALGTSLPELSVTISAARQGKAELAVGNVLGSNVFNTLYVMALPALLTPLPIPPSLLDFGLPVLLVATGLFVIFSLDRRISFGEGLVLAAGYGVFFAGVLFT